MAQFRFEELDIWKRACDVGDELCDLADALEKKRLYRFAEQLRGAALSISNNIAEGSGSSSKPEFKNFLNYARSAVSADANMLAFFERRGHISNETKLRLFNELEQLSKMILSFIRSL